MIKAILFDLDGVLVDACEWHYITLNKALQEVVGFEISREDHESTYNGLSTKVKLKMLGIEDSKISQKIWQRKQDLTWETIDRLAKKDNKKRTTHWILKEKGYKLAVVTNAIKKSAKLMLEKTKQIKYMEFIIGNEDVENNKPHPDCYLLAMKNLEVEPNETLIVEDSEKGKKAAYASGAFVLEVKNSTEVTAVNILNRIEEIEGR
jgi:beta-phosphoglucomutase